MDKLPYSGGQTFISIIITTFSTVFLAEIGDKTQIAIFLLSTQSDSPLLVFIGAAVALIASSLIGVVLGQWLSQVFPKEKLELIAGALMIALSLWIMIESLHELNYV